MLRVLFIGVVLSSFIGKEGATNSIAFDKTVKQASSKDAIDPIDPIVTGETITDEHKRLWKIQNKKYLECGLCGEEAQAFPGE